MDSPYPVTFSVDYPDRDLNRWSTFFRIFAAIPIGIVLAGITNGSSGVLFLPVLLMVLFRRKYPRWWFDWNLQLLRFSNRVSAYIFLMDDRYPSTDEQQAVHLDFPYPDAQLGLKRWLPLVKWLLAIPHYVVLFFLSIAALVVYLISWFAILVTGRYPRGMFTFLEGVLRWTNRVTGYAFILVTDVYPPFRLAP